MNKVFYVWCARYSGKYTISNHKSKVLIQSTIDDATVFTKEYQLEGALNEIRKLGERPINVIPISVEDDGRIFWVVTELMKASECPRCSGEKLQEEERAQMTRLGKDSNSKTDHLWKVRQED